MNQIAATPIFPKPKPISFLIPQINFQRTPACKPRLCIRLRTDTIDDASMRILHSPVFFLNDFSTNSTSSNGSASSSLAREMEPRQDFENVRHIPYPFGIFEFHPKILESLSVFSPIFRQFFSCIRSLLPQ